MVAMTRERIGRILSSAAVALPVAGFLLLMIYGSALVALNDNDRIPVAIFALYLFIVVAGGLAGIVYLLGMRRWGYRYWASATVGLAISLFLLRMAYIGLRYPGID